VGKTKIPRLGRARHKSKPPNGFGGLKFSIEGHGLDGYEGAGWVLAKNKGGS